MTEQEIEELVARALCGTKCALAYGDPPCRTVDGNEAHQCARDCTDDAACGALARAAIRAYRDATNG